MTEPELNESETLGTWIGGVGFPIALLIIGAAPLVLAGQILFWLRRGEWLEIPFGLLPAYMGLQPESIGWLGVRSIVLSIYNLPMWMGLVLLGLGLAFLVDKLAELIDGRA